MGLRKIKYKIVECVTSYNQKSHKTFWIKKETIILGFWKSIKILGDYKIDETFGELGDMPFFTKKSAKERIKQLKNKI